MSLLAFVCKTFHQSLRHPSLKLFPRRTITFNHSIILSLRNEMAVKVANENLLSTVSLINQAQIEAHSNVRKDDPPDAFFEETIRLLRLAGFTIVKLHCPIGQPQVKGDIMGPPNYGGWIVTSPIDRSQILLVQTVAPTKGDIREHKDQGRKARKDLGTVVLFCTFATKTYCLVQLEMLTTPRNFKKLFDFSIKKNMKLYEASSMLKDW